MSVPLENFKTTITAKELEGSLTDVGGKYSCRYWEVDIKSIITYYVVYNEELKSCLGNKMDLGQTKAGVWLWASLNKESVVAWGVWKFGHWGNWGSSLFGKTWGSYIATTFINICDGGHTSVGMDSADARVGPHIYVNWHLITTTMFTKFYDHLSVTYLLEGA